MTEDDAELQEAVESAGFFTTFQPIEEPGDRIVCTSRRRPEGHERNGPPGGTISMIRKTVERPVGRSMLIPLSV